MDEQELQFIISKRLRQIKALQRESVRLSNELYEHDQAIAGLRKDLFTLHSTWQQLWSEK